MACLAFLSFALGTHTYFAPYPHTHPPHTNPPTPTPAARVKDDDGFPEVKLLLGRALRMSQRLHHPVLPRIRREVECFAVVPERDYLLGFLTLEPPSICTL